VTADVEARAPRYGGGFQKKKLCAESARSELFKNALFAEKKVDPSEKKSLLKKSKKNRLRLFITKNLGGVDFFFGEKAIFGLPEMRRFPGYLTF